MIAPYRDFDIDACQEYEFLWISIYKDTLNILMKEKMPGSRSEDWARMAGKHADVCLEEYEKRFIKKEKKA